VLVHGVDISRPERAGGGRPTTGAVERVL